MTPKCPKVQISSHLGLNFGELGANLGQLRVDLGTTWYQLRSIWPKATPKLTQSVPKSPQSGSKLTPEFHTGQLFDGRISPKVKHSLTFWATLPSKRCPVCFIEKGDRKVKIRRKFNFLGYSTLKTLSRTRAAARTPKGDKSAHHSHSAVRLSRGVAKSVPLWTKVRGACIQVVIMPI